MSRLCIIEIDSDLDSKLIEFNKQLKEGEEIVSTVTAGTKLIITIKESKKKHRNLLLEETRKA